MMEFLTQNAVAVVMSIVLLTWLGIFLYLLKLDKRITNVEEKGK